MVVCFRVVTFCLLFRTTTILSGRQAEGAAGRARLFSGGQLRELPGALHLWHLFGGTAHSRAQQVLTPSSWQGTLFTFLSFRQAVTSSLESVHPPQGSS
jgi:hypothetical protein